MQKKISFQIVLFFHITFKHFKLNNIQLHKNIMEPLLMCNVPNSIP